MYYFYQSFMLLTLVVNYLQFSNGFELCIKFCVLVPPIKIFKRKDLGGGDTMPLFGNFAANAPARAQKEKTRFINVS